MRSFTKLIHPFTSFRKIILLNTDLKNKEICFNHYIYKVRTIDILYLLIFVSPLPWSSFPIDFPSTFLWSSFSSPFPWSPFVADLQMSNPLVIRSSLFALFYRFCSMLTFYAKVQANAIKKNVTKIRIIAAYYYKHLNG